MDIKRIYNPLTIIAIFAGLAEIAGTGIIPFINTDLQKIFIWYVMGFPLILVGLFFVTLNFNHKTLYSPSDFSDENNFIKALFMKNEIVKNSEITSGKIEQVKNDIKELKRSDEYKELADKLIQNIDTIKQNIEENQKNTYRLFDNVEISNKSLHNKVQLFIHENDNTTIEDIANRFGITRVHAKFIISNLEAMSLVYSQEKDGRKYYKEIIF
jgi:hypothetical protein